jgi:phospholipase/carboxylesterase
MMRFSIALLLLITCMSTTTSCYVAEKPALEYLIHEPTVKTAKPTVVILLHGYGSNEKDLFSLAQYFPDSFLIIAARAPVILGNESYAWFQVDYSKKTRIPNLEQEVQSRTLILKFIDQMKKQYAFNNTQLYLGGFSQGGIMSYNVGLSHPDQMKGIFVLSGILGDEVKPTIVTPDKLKNLRIFISHGTNDPVLSISQARESVTYLKGLGLNPLYKEYTAVHTITNDMLTDLLNWLKD